MKTVQDYRDLGLVLSDGDKLSSAVDDGWVCGKEESHLPLRYHGVVSFAWRNNDGVKPEYNGLIHAMFENGVIIQDFADSLSWGSSFNSIIQWRPVVSMRNHTELKPRHSFVTAISIDGPKFWNKSMPIFSCPCVAANVEAIKPAVSPKEDKPMKPVYTAEMHARNELPPVDSKVKVCIEEAGFYVDEQDVKFEGKAVTVKAAFINTESEKIVTVENEDGNCYCYIIECIKPIIKTIKVNGFDVPAPMSEAPELGSEYFIPNQENKYLTSVAFWMNSDFDRKNLANGLCYDNPQHAVMHTKALLGIDPNA